MVDVQKFKGIAALSKSDKLRLLWDENNNLYDILKSSTCLLDARMRVSDLLKNFENQYFRLFSDSEKGDMSLVQRNYAKESLRVLKNITRVENEKAAGFSSLEHLFKLAQDPEKNLEESDDGFICEFIFLFRGVHGHYNDPATNHTEDFRNKKGRAAATVRSAQLDKYSTDMTTVFKRYRDGLDKKLVGKSEIMKQDILEYFGGTEEDWNDFTWQMKHIIKDKKTIQDLTLLSDEEIAGLDLAAENGIDVHITPYYMTLFNKKGIVDHDRVIRTLVMPSKHYCTEVYKNRNSGNDLDFMGEKSTSPVDCITRRYPQILILKPFDACPQICVYCQRNWEIKDVDETCITQSKVDEAIRWIKEDSAVTEVLLTGGDPLTLNNKKIDEILGKICEIPHVERIRIGTRTLVTAPMRIDQGFCDILEKYHVPGRREIAIMTHFEHAREITPEVMTATTRIRKCGVSIYNQQVFTYYNSRKFETCFLRKKLRLAGIDPYYSFNTKGKDETSDFRVPMARLEQEVKEEARLLPGLVRTDEAVFNVPMLGKSHLRAWQDHEPIMIMPDGRRSFRFYPWEVNTSNTDSYIYTDVSIYDYLIRLQEDGEDVNEYKTIWYFF